MKLWSQTTTSTHDVLDTDRGHLATLASFKGADQLPEQTHLYDVRGAFETNYGDYKACKFGVVDLKKATLKL